MKYERITKPCKRLKTGLLDNYTGYVNGEYMNRLQELEDKLENGTLIELPCKVGDYIFIIEKTFPDGKYHIKEEQIIGIEINNSNSKDIAIYYIYEYSKSYYERNHYVFGAIYNKTWFTDLDKAEERLKDLKND